MSVNSRASSYLSWDHQQSVENLTDEFGTKLSLDSKDIYDQRRLYTKASVRTSESSEHHLEHLCTFSLCREEGVASVEEAVRKLRLQEARGRVWAQQLVLHVDTNCLRLLDVITKEVFDRFPFSSVLMVRSVRGVDLESSLLTLSVKESTEPYPEIHIFQCEQPHLICDEIDGAISSFSSTLRSRGSARSSPSDVGTGFSTSSSAAAHRSIMDTMRLANNKSARTRVTRLFDPDDDDPVDINVDSEEVNHVLGDIEAFVGRLQMASEALQQLTTKRKRRLLSRKKAGDGLLKQRAQFPPEAEFFDILQKFKHGFNLLGRLRDKISDPTSEELVSILFEFLKVVVFHSRGPTGLAPSVVAPLLTSAALALLATCLAAESSLMLGAMGDAWGKSRHEWPADRPVAPYRPEFREGRQAPPPTTATTTSTTATSTTNSTTPPPSTVGSVRSYQQTGLLSLGRPRWRDFDGDDDGDGGGDVGGDGDGRSVAEQHDKPLPAVPRKSAMKKDTSARRETPARMVAVMQNFAARNNEELFVSRGDKVQVLDDSKKWWKVRDQGGREGFVPASILQTGTPGGDAPSTQGAAGAVTSLGLSSSADDVTCWLQQQGHDTTLVDALSGLDGREILSLTRKELMEICGPADGQKLEKELRMLREK